MARNKHPEQTVEKILDTAEQLFIEKGYEKTSIQDILTVLGLSKGGLYHHFSGKEELLEAVLHRRSENLRRCMDQILQTLPNQNGREKLIGLLKYFGENTETHRLDGVMLGQLNDPRFIIDGMRQTLDIDAVIIAKLIEEGNEDGSLQIADPLACAEVFLMLLNIWTNPILFQRNAGETLRRLRFLQSMMKTCNLDILSDELISELMGWHRQLDAFLLPQFPNPDKN